MPELKPLKPLKLPGEKDPTQAISTCPFCNSCVNQNEQECQNCHQVITPHQGRPHPRKVPQKEERYKDYGPKLDFTMRGRPIAASKVGGRGRKRDEDHAKHDKDTVKDEYISDDFNMCMEPKRKSLRNVDVRKDEIMRSCLDLEIDG